MNSIKPYIGVLVGAGIVLGFAVAGANGVPVAERYTDVLFGIAIAGGVAGTVGARSAVVKRPPAPPDEPVIGEELKE